MIETVKVYAQCSQNHSQNRWMIPKMIMTKNIIQENGSGGLDFA